MPHDAGVSVPLDLESADFPAYSFINATSFFNCYLDSRILWGRGRFRGGKTLLATAIAYEFVRNGWCRSLWTNYGARFACPVVPPLRDGIFVLDEAAEFFDARDYSQNKIRDYLRYPGKFDLWFAFPSVQAIDVRARTLAVEPKWHVGTMYWFYKWYYENGDTKDKGMFVLRNPRALFPCYTTKSTTRPVTPDAGFADALDVTIELDRRHISNWNGLDFYLPWMLDTEYMPELEGVPFAQAILDNVRDQRKPKKGKSAAAHVIEVSAGASMEVIPGGRRGVPSYPG